MVAAWQHAQSVFDVKHALLLVFFPNEKFRLSVVINVLCCLLRRCILSIVLTLICSLAFFINQRTARRWEVGKQQHSHSNHSDCLELRRILEPSHSQGLNVF